MRRLTNIALVLLVVLVSACSKRELNTKTSNTTGWSYTERKANWKFDAREGVPNVDPVGTMVAIQGGTVTVGENNEFLTAPRNTQRRSISVNSFYMDKYEITNLNWREYTEWMQIVFGGVTHQEGATDLVKLALPDTTVWREEMAYNDPLEIYYFRHPAFSFYPVVGVSWNQAMDYCQWRTDRVNEMILMQSGKINYVDFTNLQPHTVSDVEGYGDWTDDDVNNWAEEHPGYEMQEIEVREWEDAEGVHTVTTYAVPYEWIRDKFVFNTAKYLYSKTYNDPNDPDPLFYNPKHPEIDMWGNPRKVTSADGILVVGYRLPTEAEWEFAAFAPVAGEDGLTIEGKQYPWSGYHPRDLGKDKKTHGQMQANFVRARGDYMGVSGALNDHYQTTGPVDEYKPNDFGLYNMAGNVNEWVLDVYRETTAQETSEYNAFRGNIYSKPVKEVGEDGYDVYTLDSLGRIAITWEGDDDKRDWKDGDFASLIDTDFPLDTVGALNLSETVRYDPTDLLAQRITKNTRVYKGGSWKDRVYWLNPTSRRYLEQDKCSSTIGFRCAMSTVGDQIPNDSPTKKSK